MVCAQLCRRAGGISSRPCYKRGCDLHEYSVLGKIRETALAKNIDAPGTPRTHDTAGDYLSGYLVCAVGHVS